MTSAFLVLKLYLTNNVTAWTPPPSKEPTSASDARVDAVAELGLVNVTNSTTNPPKRARRGLTGITSLGRRTIREGVYLLKQRYRDRNLGFYTATLPSLAPRYMKMAAKNWAAITKHMTREMSRDLVRNGASPNLCYVTEVQSERLEEYGEVGLHLHIVFNSRGKTTGWAINTKRFDELWANALEASLGYRPNVDYAGKVIPLNDAPIEELTKYMSKGRAMVKRVIELGLQDYLPASWWGCTDALRDAIKAATITLKVCVPELMRMIAADPARWLLWSKDIMVELPSAYTWKAAMVGQFTRWGAEQVRRLYAVSMA